MNEHLSHSQSPSALRKCRKCGHEKTVTEFRPDKKASNGRLYPRNQCRECESAAWRRDWRAGKKGRQSGTLLALSAPPAASRTDTEMDDTLRESIEQRMILYRSDALDALHDLATMPISENSAQNQVKLAAARLLAGALLLPEGMDHDGEMEKMLRDLNEQYQKAAPKIKAIRERIVTFDQGATTVLESK